jgi:chromosome segregation ATPase
MFRAIGRLFKALGYLLTGRIDDARKALMLNPNVVQANYDEIITDKTTRLQTYKKAVAGLITQQEGKMQKLKDQTTEANKYEQLKAGAAAKAKNLVQQIGNNPEAVRGNAEYQKCQAAYRDFSSTLEEKQKMIVELEQDVKGLTAQIATHKTTMNSLLREIDRLKGEKHEAVAEIISSKQEKEIADMLSGISEDKTQKELQELREVRNQARAEARISREVAGVTAKQSEDEFLGFATNSKADNEFEKMVGLTNVQSELLDSVIQATDANKATKESK